MGWAIHSADSITDGELALENSVEHAVAGAVAVAGAAVVVAGLGHPVVPKHGML